MVITIKFIVRIIRRIVFSFMLLFGLNVMIKSMGIIIPINIINVIFISILGVPGLVVLLIIKLFII